MAPRRAQSKPRLRLLKVVVQPTFVLDDGESLREVTGSVANVVGADWPTWALSAFDDVRLADLCAALDDQRATEEDRST